VRSRGGIVLAIYLLGPFTYQDQQHGFLLSLFYKQNLGFVLKSFRNMKKSTAARSGE
jgi:hypothetical protein